MVGNWYFISGMILSLLPVIWFVTDRIIEPRLNILMPSDGISQTAGIVKSPESELKENEIRGLKYSGVALLVVVFLWTLLCALPGTPLINESAQGISRFNPLLQSLVAGFLYYF